MPQCSFQYSIMLEGSFFIVFLFFVASLQKCWNESSSEDISYSNDPLNRPTVDLFTLHRLVPPLFPVTPPQICQIIFKPNVSIETAEPYPYHQLNHRPTIKWEVKPNRFYTLYVLGTSNLVFVFPNYVIPCRYLDFPKSQWIHWLVTDIPGTDIKNGTTLFQFVNFQNPEQNVRLAYIFLIFEQENKKMQRIMEKNLSRSPTRYRESNFTPVDKFMKIHEDFHLVAGNFFYIKPDELTTLIFKEDMLNKTLPTVAKNYGKTPV